MPRDDQLGTPNYITPAKIAGAAALAGVAIKTFFFPNACGILQLHALRMFREKGVAVLTWSVFEPPSESFLSTRPGFAFRYFISVNDIRKKPPA